ncbi:MAG: TAXI family TRAP transporter solute-binding subunit [Candidatus Aminicenantes bacterium]|nr:TAXI family TRAP transporter solute-binding subunit [Candidatus Aminicenantes bacterium]
MRNYLISIGFILMVMICVASCDTTRGKITFISIGTGGTGGAYYPYGGGLAEIWSKYVPGIKVLAEVTAASVENVRLAHKGETVIGEIMGDVAYQAFYGSGKFKKSGPQKILALAVMYPSTLQVVTLKGSGLNNLQQLKNRVVSIGAPGSGTAFMSELILTALDIPLESISTRRLSFVETSNALKDHTIRAGIWCVAPPTSSILDLSTTHDINIIPFPAENQAAICRKYPYYSAFNLPADLYRGVDKVVPTISVWNIIICYSNLSEDLIYSLTKVLFEHNDYMKQVHPYARFTTMKNTIEHSPIPLHTGTIKYLREKGFSIPEKLILNKKGK